MGTVYCSNRGAHHNPGQADAIEPNYVTHRFLNRLVQVSVDLRVGIGLKIRENPVQRNKRAAEWAVLGGEGAHKWRFVGVDFSDDMLNFSYTLRFVPGRWVSLMRGIVVRARVGSTRREVEY